MPKPTSSPTPQGVPSLAPYSVACHYLGAPTAGALRRWVQRGILPGSVILKVGDRLRLVDIPAAVEALRRRAAPPPEAPKPAAEQA